MTNDLIEIKGKDETDMDAFQFCIKALDLKDKRIYIKNLLIDNGFVIGTDSRRLHKAKLKNIYKDGIYRVFKKLKNHIILFKVMDREENYPYFKPIFDITDAKVCRGGDFYKHNYIESMTNIIRMMPVKTTINPDYLKDLDDTFDITIMEEGRINLENKNKSAVIMALHHDN